MRAACRSIASPPKATAGPDAASAANPTAAAANIDRCICDTSEIYLHTLGFRRSNQPALQMTCAWWSETDWRVWYCTVMPFTP